MIIRRKHWYPADVCPRCKGVVNNIYIYLTDETTNNSYLDLEPRDANDHIFLMLSYALLLFL